MGAQQDPQGESGVWRRLLPLLRLSYWTPGLGLGQAFPVFEVGLIQFAKVAGKLYSKHIYRIGQNTR